MFIRFARWLGLAAAALALSGCYGLKTTIITAERAEEIPNIEGRFRSVDEGDQSVLLITRTDGTNDYLIGSDDPAEPAENKVLLRGFKLNDSFYVVELSNPLAPEEGVILAFIATDPNGLAITTLPEGMPQQLAAQHGVTVGEDGVALDGEVAALMAFVEAHADQTFMEPQAFLVRAD